MKVMEGVYVMIIIFADQLNVRNAQETNASPNEDVERVLPGLRVPLMGGGGRGVRAGLR